MMMMEVLVIFNVCLWPWLAYWCLVVASLPSQFLRSLPSSLSLIIMIMIDDDWWWCWWKSFQIFLIVFVFDDYGDDDDGEDNDNHLLRSASSSLSFFSGVLSLASSSKDGVVCYYQSCNCQIIFFPIGPAACVSKLVLQEFLSLSLCQCKPNWSFIEVFDWLIKPFNLRVHCVVGNVFIVSTFNFQSLDRQDQGTPALPAGVQQRALCQAWSSSWEKGEKGETYFGIFIKF